MILIPPHTAQKGGAEVEPSDVTIPELLARLSYCSPPTVSTLVTARALTSTITALAVSGIRTVQVADGS